MTKPKTTAKKTAAKATAPRATAVKATTARAASARATTPAKAASAAKPTPTIAKAAPKPTPAPAGELPIIAFPTPSAWSDWLAANHAASRGLWLKLAKKASGIASVTYLEAVDVALAWGWIDGLKRSFDDVSWIQKFTPRGAKSLWSKINREKALALIASGQMKPSGVAEVERAKLDGRWEAAYDAQSKATIPDDLAAALAANPRAGAFFATLNAANRYAVLFRVQTAKKPDTRARRIEQLVEMLGRSEKLHP
jgi:uncharacterized protein YdeI (YjbR/CyaY-like superfamily)